METGQTQQSTRSRGGGLPESRWLVIGGLLILAFNLRPLAVALGPFLPTITGELGMGPALAGLLTALPVLCFSGFGALAPMAAARFGVHRVMLTALGLVIVGQLIRAATGSALVFLLSTMVGLSGMAAANVLLPSLVKLHYSHRVGLVTALYSTSMTIGVAAASMLTVPIAHALGGWRWGLGIWAITAAVAVLPWLLLVRHDSPDVPTPGEATAVQGAPISIRQVARTRLGWILAVFFGVQSMQAYAIFGWLATMYQDAGYSTAASGFFLGISAVVGIPLAFLFPAYTARKRQPSGLLVLIFCCLVGGYVGLLLAPSALPWLWAILLALGTAAFPVILALIGLRARTSQGTAALSGFTQSVGYLIAAPGPFLVGVLHAATGGWVVPKLFLIALAIPLLVMGLLAVRPKFLEDELEHRRQRR
ncbi:CynX/NimT family MFS transporter [Microlunatus panaciterrae]|uniref:CP family cyanate transporter-like MFS transporter n=1 Tax=Microlunatus panaciterrae TaxID=400768 RepID=A0ABS2RLT9_9ACTN|nr:MFS transporter [Microlunatus panaciterrae]MBM7799952.1 CP family cyanate transporter-like MFS transporter [Microlunatus panaciterrae]